MKFFSAPQLLAGLKGVFKRWILLPWFFSNIFTSSLLLKEE